MADALVNVRCMLSTITRIHTYMEASTWKNSWNVYKNLGILRDSCQSCFDNFMTIFKEGRND